MACQACLNQHGGQEIALLAHVDQLPFGTGKSEKRVEDTPEFKQFADQFTKSGGNFFVGTAIIALAWMMRSLTRPDTQEISFQHFKTQLLAKDVVDRIEVANKTTAKVVKHQTLQHCCIITAYPLICSSTMYW